MTLSIPNWKVRHTCAAVFVLCFCFLAAHPEARLFGLGLPENGEIVKVARSLAFHGTFADPFGGGPTGETAHIAPAYALLLAAYIKAFGTGWGAQIGLGAITVGFFALQLALLPWISDSLGLGWGIGAIAAALGAVSAHVSLDGSWEQYFAGLLLLLTFALTARTKSAPRAVLIGLLWGVLILTNPVFVLLLAAWPFILWPRENFRRKFAATLVATALVVTPWIIRDYARFGAVIFVRDNLGLELAVANNPCAMPDLHSAEDSGCFNQYHPNANPEVARELAAQGEYALNQKLLRQSLAWIDGNRRRFAALTAQRVRAFWFPTLVRRWEQPLVWSVTVLAFAGLALLWRRQTRIGVLIAVTWVLYPAIYYLVAAEPRYAYPIVWTLLLPAGAALRAVAERLQIAKLFPNFPTSLPNIAE
jgi:hypothetical protein